MTIDEFSKQMIGISNDAQVKLHNASLNGAYQSIPVPVLQRLYMKHRNLNFNVPGSVYELVLVTFGFVTLDAIRRMKELYFASLSDPDSWPTVIEACKEELELLISAVTEEFAWEAERSSTK